MSFEDDVNKVSDKVGASSGGFFKVKEGDNKMRVLAEPTLFVSRFKFGVCYTDCGYCSKEALEKDKDAKTGKPANLTYKFLTWIYDYADKEIKLYSMPFSISQQIVDLKKDQTNGYDFDKFPMPYDITIQATGAGTKEVKYTIKPARENTEVPAEVLEALEKEATPEQVINSMKDKAKNKAEGTEPKKVDYPEEDIKPEDIPF